jgi:hypothetical protein
MSETALIISGVVVLMIVSALLLGFRKRKPIITFPAAGYKPLQPGRGSGGGPEMSGAPVSRPSPPPTLSAGAEKVIPAGHEDKP